MVSDGRASETLMASSSAADDSGSSGRIERFDGNDPSQYRRWKRRARLMLASLPNTVPKEKYGPRLMEFIKGEAEILLETLDIDKICKEGGDDAIFKVLDEKYGPQPVDLLNTAFKTFFYELHIHSGETYMQFHARFTSAIRLLEEQEVKFPEVVKGYLLLKKLKLDSNQEAMVLTAAEGKLDQVWRSVQRIFAEGKAGNVPKGRDVLQAEPDDGMDSAGYQEDEVQMVMESVADEAQDHDLSDEGALEAFESYAEVRKRLQEERIARGFSGTKGKGKGKGEEQQWHLTGNISAKLAAIKGRTRCHVCQRLGRWKKECPLRKNAAAEPDRKKEVNVIENSDVLLVEAFPETAVVQIDEQSHGNP